MSDKDAKCPKCGGPSEVTETIENFGPRHIERNRRYRSTHDELMAACEKQTKENIEKIGHALADKLDNRIAKLEAENRALGASAEAANDALAKYDGVDAVVEAAREEVSSHGAVCTRNPCRLCRSLNTLDKKESGGPCWGSTTGKGE